MRMIGKRTFAITHKTRALASNCQLKTGPMAQAKARNAAAVTTPEASSRPGRFHATQRPTTSGATKRAVSAAQSKLWVPVPPMKISRKKPIAKNIDADARRPATIPWATAFAISQGAQHTVLANDKHPICAMWSQNRIGFPSGSISIKSPTVDAARSGSLTNDRRDSASLALRMGNPRKVNSFKQPFVGLLGACDGCQPQRCDRHVTFRPSAPHSRGIAQF